MKRIAIRDGVVFGLITSVPVIVLTFVANTFFGLPFPPFDLFDFMARVLPGGLVTFGIDTIISIIMFLGLGNIADSAAIAEQIIAIGQFVLVGGMLGLVYGLLGTRNRTFDAWTIGLSIGAVFFGFFSAIEYFLDFSPAGPVLSILWLGVVFFGWNIGLAWIVRGIVEALHLPGEDPSRRRALYLGITGLVAFVAGIVGIGMLGNRSASQESSGMPGETDLEPDMTSGPAASPSGEALTNRIDPVSGTRSEVTANEDFYTIDINLSPPDINIDEWQLEVSGLVDNPRTFSMDDIRALPSVSQYITLSCISNPIGGDLISTSLWTGVPLPTFLQEVEIQDGAGELYIEAADGFYESVSAEDMQDPRTLLVYEMNRQPLPVSHGFPLRIYIPNRYGMKQPKWITRMEVIPDMGAGYWVDRNWSAEARPRVVSIIDVVNVDDSSSVDIGGIAWAGDRGISQVEIQIDDGAWQPAELRLPALSPLTWIQWRYSGSVESGRHTARVRAYDGEGTMQIVESSGTRPDGATGIHSRSFQT